jgi:hypothetical protein
VIAVLQSSARRISSTRCEEHIVLEGGVIVALGDAMVSRVHSIRAKTQQKLPTARCGCTKETRREQQRQLYSRSHFTISSVTVDNRVSMTVPVTIKYEKSTKDNPFYSNALWLFSREAIS